MTDTRSSSGSAVAWRWRTLPKFSEDAADQEWSLSSTEPNFINAHHHEVEPLYVTAAQAQRDPFDICKMIVEEECYLDLKPPKYTVGFAIRDRINAAQRETSTVPSATRATGPLVPWELDCQRAVCAAPECECPTIASTERGTP